MKTKIVFLSMIALMTVASVAAQESYSWTKVKRGGWLKPKSIPINWLPEQDSVEYPYRRHTVAIDFGQGVYSGFKFDYEGELRGRPGEWISVGFIGYYVPTRRVNSRSWYYYDYYGNNRYGPASGWDDFKNVWGVGTAVSYKRMLHRRGWYVRAGIEVEFFRVGIGEDSYDSFEQDGLTFYTRADGYTKMRSYFKPSAVVAVGKHFAFSRRCFLDIYIGIKYSYSIYKPDPNIESYYDSYYGKTYTWSYEDYSRLNGFAYRGFAPYGGFRFGVLLWKQQ